MDDSRMTPETNGVRYGLYTAIAMMIYFLIASLLGLAGTIELSYLNALILAIGIWIAIRHFKKVRHGRIAYLQGFVTGIMTAIVASAVFGVFFIVYAVINPNLMEQLSASNLFGFDLSVTVAFMAIVLQGIMSGVIISLIAMQYFKSPDHMPMEGAE